LRAGVGNLDLGAQLVEAEPLGKLRRLRCRGVEQELVRSRSEDQEIEQDLALRGQERGVARAADRQRLHIVGEQALQEALGVRPRDPCDAAFL
jgi:hypothetical protein